MTEVIHNIGGRQYVYDHKKVNGKVVCKYLRPVVEADKETKTALRERIRELETDIENADTRENALRERLARLADFEYMLDEGGNDAGWVSCMLHARPFKDNNDAFDIIHIISYDGETIESNIYEDDREPIYNLIMVGGETTSRLIRHGIKMETKKEPGLRPSHDTIITDLLDSVRNLKDKNNDLKKQIKKLAPK